LTTNQALSISRALGISVEVETRWSPDGSRGPVLNHRRALRPFSLAPGRAGEETEPVGMGTLQACAFVAASELSKIPTTSRRDKDATQSSRFVR
jgi:hypothetical protein